MGLENRLSSEIGLLSGGQRQAITLLMATLQRPELILLDEHTAALDPATSKTVMELTEKLITEQNLTAFMVTHDMEDAIRYGSRLIMLHQGRIVVDIQQEEKQQLTVPQLLALFKQNSGTALKTIKYFYLHNQKEDGTKMNAHPLLFLFPSFVFALCINRCFFENYFVLSFFLIEWMGKELDAMTTKDKVLQLLKKTPDFLSGEKLAQQLEVSRTSIWKAIKELEKAGYRFEHGPTGYRYLPSDVLDAKEIQQELRSFIPDLKVQTMLTSESTMKDAKLAAAQGDSVSKLFVADTQEQARGRFGRPFSLNLDEEST